MPVAQLDGELAFRAVVKHLRAVRGPLDEGWLKSRSSPSRAGKLKLYRLPVSLAIECRDHGGDEPNVRIAPEVPACSVSESSNYKMLGRNDVDPLSEIPASEVAVLGAPVRRNLRFDFNQFGSAALTCAITGPMTSIRFVMSR